ncbi:MAG: hypothetical protein PHS54_00685 [Clostridia bacterium]|nr:hypothetical protein [Clostridia bacterium]
MKTFKQYIEENNIDTEDILSSLRLKNLTELKSIVTTDPFNFTWIYNEDFKNPIPDNTLLAYRKIPYNPEIEILDGVHEVKFDKNKFEIKYNPTGKYDGNFTLGFPASDGIMFTLRSQKRNGIYDGVLPPLFYMYQTNDSLYGNESFKENWDKHGVMIDKYFELYNYFLTTKGPRENRIIETIEHFIPFFKQQNLWSHEDNVLFVKLKQKYMSEDQLNTDDWSTLAISRF